MTRHQLKLCCSGLPIVAAGLITTAGLGIFSTESVASKFNPNAVVKAMPLPEFRQRLRVWIHRSDVRPRVIYASAGRTLIDAENLTAADASLCVEKVFPNTDNSLNPINIPAHSKRVKREVTLAVGEYKLYEMSRPEITARLVIEPR